MLQKVHFHKAEAASRVRDRSRRTCQKRQPRSLQIDVVILVKAVEANNFVATINETPGSVESDESCASGYQDFRHDFTLAFAPEPCARLG